MRYEGNARQAVHCIVDQPIGLTPATAAAADTAAAMPERAVLPRPMAAFASGEPLGTPAEPVLLLAMLWMCSSCNLALNHAWQPWACAPPGR